MINLQESYAAELGFSFATLALQSDMLPTALWSLALYVIHVYLFQISLHFLQKLCKLFYVHETSLGINL